MRSRLLFALFVLAALIVPAHASAFCGFYVSGAGGPLVNDATQVVLMRSGLRTVLSMANDYRGPPESFALVIPVPVVLQKENVRTLPRSVLTRLDRLDAPRLVEYWEQDPCPAPDDMQYDNKEGGTGTRARGEEGRMGKASRKPLVKVEAEFSVGEYEIVILSALDAVALDTWLRDNRYAIPKGAGVYLKPYVEAGSKFFVAKVDPRKVSFTWGRATLSPLRFHYDSESFSLPVRLGLLNADGPQDLVIHILAPSFRYEVANYDNLFIPTNLEVTEAARDRFPSFYAALFDRTVAGRPRAVVTEYAWSAASCDPCPVPPLGADDLATLGGDVIPGFAAQGITLTRLHARYTRDTLGEDLVFRAAPPVQGGRESSHGGNSKVATPAESWSTFQARYILRHPWEGPVTCSDPSWGLWGGPPDGAARPPASATRDPRAKRDVPLAEMLAEDDARLGVRAKAPRGRPGAFDRLQRAARSATSGALLAAAAIAAIVMVVLAAHRAGERIARSLFALFLACAVPSAIGLFAVIYRTPRGLRDLLMEVGRPLSSLAAAYALAAGAVLGLRLRDAKRAPLVVALVPAAIGLVVESASFQIGLSAARGPEVDPEMVARILAESQAEAAGATILGLWLSALLLVVAAWPRARAMAVPGRALAAIAAGALVLVTTHLAAGIGWADAVLAIVMIAAAILASRTQEHVPAEAWRSVIAAGLAAFFVALAALVERHRAGLGAAWGTSLTAEQQLTALVDMLRAERVRAILLPVAAIAAAAPIAWGAGRPDRRAIGAALPAIAASVALLLAGVRQRAALDAHLEGSATASRFSGVSGLTLPASVAKIEPNGELVEARLGGPAIVVPAGGALLASVSSAAAPRPYEDALFAELGAPSPDADLAGAPLLAADARLSVEALFRALAPLLAKRQSAYDLLAGPPFVDARAAGRYRALVDAPRARGVRVEITRALEIDAQADPAKLQRSLALGFVIDGETARAVELAGRAGFYEGAAKANDPTLPLGDADAARAARRRFFARHGLPDELVLGCAPDMDLGALARVIATLLPDAGRRLHAVVVTTDRASLERAIAEARASAAMPKGAPN
jgi:hypothetical protein